MTPFLVLLVTAVLVSSFKIASSQPQGVVRGRITDALTGMPLKGVEVLIYGYRHDEEYHWRPFTLSFFTNETGDYNISLSQHFYWMGLGVKADNPDTPGMDYVPAYIFLRDMIQELSPEQGDIITDFQLLPGATVRLMGSPEFVETGGVTEMYFSFYSLDQRFAYLSSRTLTAYDANVRQYLGLGPSDMIVIADTPIVLYGSNGGGLSFTDDNDSCYFEFPQGSITTVDISEAAMMRNVISVRDGLSVTWQRAEKLSLNGIDVKTELNDLGTAFDFLTSARQALGEGSYSQCFVNLRAAYIINDDVRSRVENIFTDVTISPIPLSFLLVLSGFGLASVLIERNAVRIGVGALMGSLFLGFYYYISPGWRLTTEWNPILLLASCILAASMAIGLAILFPRIRKDVVTPTGVALASSLTSTFSIATRNLKRRRLRSALVLISIMTLVFGFTAFTSYQMKTAVASGRPSQPYPGPQAPTGLMVVSPPGSGSGLAVSMVDSLKAEPSVDSVAPKTESSPTYMDAQLITEDGDNLTIRGVLGISSEEAKMSHLDAAVISGHLMLEDEHAIMISAKAANQLHASPGDKVKLTWNTSPGTMSGMWLTEDFMIAGVLDDNLFGQVADLDGQPIRPYILINHEKSYLSADSVAVLSWRQLLDLNIGSLTRINVQPKNASDAGSLAIKLVGKWRLFVYASVNDEVRMFYYRKDPSLAGGAEVPMLLVLVGMNVLACTLNAVYERRKEIATLSLVGLNPSQISYIFVAEAGLVAFIGGVLGYLIGVGGPRALLSIGGPGFLTEKTSWTWSVAVIMMAVAVSVSASIVPALKAATIATPKLPLRWKLEYLPAAKDTWSLHIPQLVSPAEVGRFFSFIEGRFEEMQLLRTIPEKMEKVGRTDEPSPEKDVKRFIFAHSFAQEGSRAFRTENELVATRSGGSSTYALDLSIRIAMLYNYEPMEVVKKAASAFRKIMLQWAAAPSSERWGQEEELIKVGDISVTSAEKAVLRGININVMRGEIFGLVGGGRGALISAIAGILRPTEGSVLLRGMDTFSRRGDVKKTMGVSLRGTGPYEELTVRRNLDFVAKLEGVRECEKAIDKALEMCVLKQHADARVSDLGQGDRRKLSIAQALINGPSLLLLEDPFAGLNDDEARDVESLLRDLNHMWGITIICSGESADELAFCDRIGSLKDGALGMIVDRKDVRTA